MGKRAERQKKSAPPDLELLRARAEKAWPLLEHCRLCPRKCGVNRLRGEIGVCGIGATAVVASHGPHFGEEAVLVGKNGSGAVFFAGCNLRCVFCQNADISMVRLKDGEDVSWDRQDLAECFLDLQRQGCHNINLVTPSHVVPQILRALADAVERGLRLPVVYNTSSYDSVSTLRLLEGVVSIYMPDSKFSNRQSAARYLNAPDYPQKMRAALIEMHRQVGDLQVDEQGLALQGLLVRHLVMPGHLDETGSIMQFLAREISTETYVNLMDQYHPCWQAASFPEINRTVRVDEFARAEELARAAGLHRFDRRDLSRLFARFLNRS